ncbi:calmodulin binding protein PICBP-like isoform X2 [Abrus precatorius]|uniref:Calmodulin binding protein PICBP-like isoform X2 n=1 Tax=Abrus precatorius TaxID=3816 RepID=A0A8B8L3L9_ABRPR|nr:calmodulin binding protein PICBP-like isoform X2 [Abrus precatorius]
MKDEIEGSYSDYDESQRVPGTKESISSLPENRGRLESKRKLKKVRSIRLGRLSSMRSSTRRGKPQYDDLIILSSVGTESLEGPTPIDMADASPNYMKATSSSHAKDSFQPKRKLKSSRSIKFVAVKGPKSTRKQSESTCGSDDQNGKSTCDASSKPQRVITRRLSFKPVRMLTKMPTFKAKNSSKSDSSLHRATCSSTLKDSHFPDHIDLPQEASTSQGVSSMKVCPYTYCSLHGHRHGNMPTLKRFVSMRRRMLKTQKTMKMDGQPVNRSKQFGNARKAAPKAQTVHSEDGRSHFQNMKKMASDSHIRPHGTPTSRVTEGDTSGREDEEKYNVRSNAEVLLGETSYPHTINFEEYLGDSPAVKRQTSPSVKERSMEYCCIATEKYKSDSVVAETPQSDKNMVACKKNDESATVDSTSTDVVKFSASDIEILEGKVITAGKNMEPDYEVLQKSSAQEEPTPASATDGAMQERDKKYIKMWQLMYKHAVLGNSGKCESKLPFNEKGREESGQNDLMINEVNSCSCHNHCETNQDMDDENKNAIELVQKAFDEILLPEPEDLFSDDHFKSEGIDSDEPLSEKSEGKREEVNTSTSTESPIEEQRMGTEPHQTTPKSWSNLKKMILLKRFVKALEKVRNFNPRRPSHLPSDANLEIEKVFLKHQTAEEKKNTEEWMLDYALQKVISKLAPAQRRRVTLLVEAFETILPFQDAESSPWSSATMEPKANPIQSLDDSSNHGKEEASFSHNSNMELEDNAGDDPMPELHNPIVLKDIFDYPRTEIVKHISASEAIEEDIYGNRSLAGSDDNDEKISTDDNNIYPVEIKDSRSSSLNKPVETTSSCHEEAPTNEKVSEFPEDLISNVNIENPNIKSKSPGIDVETKKLIGDNGEQFSVSKSLILEGLVRSLRSNLNGSGAPANLLDEPTADRKERIEKSKLETETLEEFPTQEQSEAPKSAVVEPETLPEKQRYTGLWYLVYKHMVSDMAENKPKSLIDEADEKESGHEGGRKRGTSISHESTPMTKQDKEFKDHVVDDPEVELQQIEAIKMVEEAIDSILPDDKDDLPDKESLAYNTISDNSKQSDRTERVYNEGLEKKEERMESKNRTIQEKEDEESAPKEGNKTNQQLPRSWSNLKKVILLRRFIKALEKVRKFNPRGPRYLPVEPDSESERVHLRHQGMEERKGTEEWMLDYALRQVVSKLTPARKRKVELLVEAFETVMPTMKN